jgi:hypothetical protein
MIFPQRSDSLLSAIKSSQPELSSLTNPYFGGSIPVKTLNWPEAFVIINLWWSFVGLILLAFFATKKGKG